MKVGRQAKIVELIGKYDIETQEELCTRLNQEGYEVTQATVSRDIRELKLTKAAGTDGRAVYRAVRPNEDFSHKYLNVLRTGYVSMDMAQNILVIRTIAGMAMAVAAAIDAMQFREVVGCIAGDDTIMVAVRTVDGCLDVMTRIRDLVDNG